MTVWRLSHVWEALPPHAFAPRPSTPSMVPAGRGAEDMGVRRVRNTGRIRDTNRFSRASPLSTCEATWLSKLSLDVVVGRSGPVRIGHRGPDEARASLGRAESRREPGRAGVAVGVSLTCELRLGRLAGHLD